MNPIVVVEARVEGDLIRVIDVNRAIRPINCRVVLAPDGTINARKQRMAHAVIVYRAHEHGMLRHRRHGDERGPALPHEHLQGSIHVLRRAKWARRVQAR